MLGIAPVRATPSERAEMVTQLLYGDICVIDGESGSWRHIRCHSDGYEGWVDALQIMPVSDRSDPLFIVSELFVNHLGRTLPMGSVFFDEKSCKDLDPATIRRLPQVFRREALIETARKFLGAPYLWGGKTGMGVDCSGLTQVVYRVHGVPLPRDSGEQAVVGQTIPLAQARPGDLAFLSGPGKEHITHVGIVLAGSSGHQILHSSGHVRVDSLTSDGIVQDDGRHTHTLRWVKDVSATGTDLIT